MQWSAWLSRWLMSDNYTAIADQAAALFEDRAWGLVERRIMWLSHRELRGYVRARTRPLVEVIVTELPASLLTIKSSPRFMEILNDQLIRRLLLRAEMARSQSQLRSAA